MLSPYRRLFPPFWKALAVDDIDSRIIALLRHDARHPIAGIAAALKLSRSTVRARIERLEQAGEIIGYTVILKAETIEMPVRGITMIEVEGRATAKVIDSLAGFPEVAAIHTTNGKWDLIAEIAAGSLSDLDSVLGRLRLIPGVTGSETNLLLATPRSTRARLG